ncbi:MAG: hypothetical protein EXS32_15535, partial [Opitutus sp.]|nr:hypothetical protein [Opitutus sp.]
GGTRHACDAESVGLRVHAADELLDLPRRLVGGDEDGMGDGGQGPEDERQETGDRRQEMGDRGRSQFQSMLPEKFGVATWNLRGAMFAVGIAMGVTEPAAEFLRIWSGGGQAARGRSIHHSAKTKFGTQHNQATAG